MDLSNFVIDRVLRGIMFNASTDAVLWSVNQVKSPALSMNADSTDATDALEAPIMTFNRAKSGEFSGENAIFDLGLLAAQSGTTKKTSTASAKIMTPCFEEIAKTAAATTYTLKHTPATGKFKYLYKLNNDGTLSDTKYAYAATASADTFSFTTTTLTFPTGLNTAANLIAIYDYEADDTDEAVEVVNSAKDFPTAGKFVLQVLGCDVCDISTKYYAYLIFPKSVLMSNFDLNFTTDATHPFTIKLMQDYCSTTNELFKLIIPEGITAA